MQVQPAVRRGGEGGINTGRRRCEVAQQRLLLRRDERLEPGRVRSGVKVRGRVRARVRGRGRVRGRVRGRGRGRGRVHGRGRGHGRINGRGRVRVRAGARVQGRRNLC